jgi:hypothetical protein
MTAGCSIQAALEPSKAILPDGTSYSFLRDEDSNGIDLRELLSGTVLNVRTHNSCYRFVVVDGVRRQVLVQGGSWFAEEAPARMDGSTLGGSRLKMGWIGVGLHLEIAFGYRQRIVTSRVRSIEITTPRN